MAYISRELVEFFFASLLVVFVLVHFVRSLNNRNNISLIDISVWITGISFGLSPFVVILFGGFFPNANIIDVFYSYIGLFIFIAGLLLVKKQLLKDTHGILNLKSLLMCVNLISNREVLFFYTAFFVIRIIFAFDYGIFASGSETSERLSSLPYLLFGLRGLLEILLFGILIWSITKILYNKRLFLLPSLIIVIETLMFFFRGRRQMLFLLFLFLYVYIVLGYRINYKILISSIIVLIFFVNVIFPIFISLRQTTVMYTSSGDIIKDYKTSYYLLSKTGVDEQLYESNVAKRSYINDWNINILKRSALFEGLNGQALLMCALWVIPRPILTFKGELKDPELLISYTYGLSLTDSPSNWPAYGFADFGLIGSLFYGIILGILLFLFQKLGKYQLKRFPFFSFTVIGSATFLAFFIEESPVALFSVLRDTVILLFLFYFFSLFNRKKTKKKIIVHKG